MPLPGSQFLDYNLAVVPQAFQYPRWILRPAEEAGLVSPENCCPLRGRAALSVGVEDLDCDRTEMVAAVVAVAVAVAAAAAVVEGWVVED